MSLMIPMPSEGSRSATPKEFRGHFGSTSIPGHVSMSTWFKRPKQTDDTQRFLDNNFPVRGKRASSDQALLGFWFSKFVVLVIIFNSVQIGVLCQWPLDMDPRSYVNIALEGIFTVIYFIEASIKIKLLGASYFNIARGVKHPMEFLIACCGALQLVWLLFESEHIDGQIQRAVQAMSLLRLLRIIRILVVLTGVPQLAITIGGLVGSAAALGWILLLLVLFAYAFAVYFVLQVNDPESPDFRDLVTAMRTMAGVVVLDKWTDVLDLDGSDHTVMDQLLLYIPFYIFAVVAVFGISNIIIGVIVDFTAETKHRLRWSEQRSTVARIGAEWEEALAGASLVEDEGHSSVVGSLAEEGEGHSQSQQLSEDGAIERKRIRNQTVDAILRDVLEKEPTRDMFPPGMKAEDIRMLLDVGGDGRVLHEDLCLGLGRLLLCSESQLRVLSLVNQAKTRRQLGNLHEKVDNLERSVSEIKGILQGGRPPDGCVASI